MDWNRLIHYMRCSHHLKGRVDGFFGRMSQYITAAAKVKDSTLTEIADVCRVCQEAYHLKEGRATEEFLDYFPKPKDTVRQVTFSKKTFPVPLKALLGFEI